jgi:hypothetical protein
LRIGWSFKRGRFSPYLGTARIARLPVRVPRQR